MLTFEPQPIATFDRAGKTEERPLFPPCRRRSIRRFLVAQHRERGQYEVVALRLARAADHVDGEVPMTGDISPTNQRSFQSRACGVQPGTALFTGCSTHRAPARSASRDSGLRKSPGGGSPEDSEGRKPLGEGAPTDLQGTFLVRRAIRCPEMGRAEVAVNGGGSGILPDGLRGILAPWVQRGQQETACTVRLEAWLTPADCRFGSHAVGAGSLRLRDLARQILFRIKVRFASSSSHAGRRPGSMGGHE